MIRWVRLKARLLSPMVKEAAHRQALAEAVTEAGAVLAGGDRGKYGETSRKLSGRYQEAAKESRVLYAVELVEAFLVALAMALVIRAGIVQAFQIPSRSMVPTLLVGDHILANKFIYRFKDVQRGDIVVFRFPMNEKQDFIKRVIGLPGDRVEIKGTTVTVNGTELTEGYTVHKELSLRPDFGPITVPANSYFVMGDNRDESYDSRFWGFVEKDNLRGKAMIIYWSWNSEGEMLGKVRWSRLASAVR